MIARTAAGKNQQDKKAAPAETPRPCLIDLYSFFLHVSISFQAKKTQA
jgi:hypothetical protein